MDTKICGVCKKEYPKTLDYFHKKITKQKLSNGEIAVYESFSYLCKNCKRIKEEDKRIKKRCIKLNCDISEYHIKWKEQYSKTRVKYKETIGLKQSLRQSIRKKIDKGYIFTTLEKYKLDCKKNMSKGARKYDYGDIDFIPKKVNSSIKHLKDGYVALCMKKRVYEVPKEILETKRLTLLIHRELNK